jgi:hypothetical protein
VALVADEGWSAAVATTTDTFEEGNYGWSIEAHFAPIGVDFIDLIVGPTQGTIKTTLARFAVAKATYPRMSAS